jgi:hypothetical protein
LQPLETIAAGGLLFPSPLGEGLGLRVRSMKMSIEERVKILETKVLALQGGNLLKEEPKGPFKDSLTKNK